MYSHGGADRPAQSWQGYTRLISDLFIYNRVWSTVHGWTTPTTTLLETERHH